MALDSLQRAEAMGYASIQFNAVVETNVAAIRLWEGCGFQIVGRIPKGFNHPRSGFVDLLIMYRSI